jgi:hypothetical protein
VCNTTDVDTMTQNHKEINKGTYNKKITLNIQLSINHFVNLTERNR